jgi:hypothetical protein
MYRKSGCGPKLIDEQNHNHNDKRGCAEGNQVRNLLARSNTTEESAYAVTLVNCKY